MSIGDYLNNYGNLENCMELELDDYGWKPVDSRHPVERNLKFKRSAAITILNWRLGKNGFCVYSYRFFEVMSECTIELWFKRWSSKWLRLINWTKKLKKASKVLVFYKPERICLINFSCGTQRSRLIDPWRPTCSSSNHGSLFWCLLFLLT